MKKNKKQKIIVGAEKIANRIFNIADHEWPRVAAAFLTKLFFQIAAVATGTILIALFVAHFSIEHLPFLLIVESVVVVLGTAIFSKILKKNAVENLIAIGAILAAGFLIAAVFFEKDAMIFFGLAIVGFSVFLAQIGIWISLFVEKIFTPLEGERAFPIVESSEPIGGILAGILIVGLFPFFEAEKMLFFVAAILVAIAPILLFSLKKINAVPRFRKKENSVAKKNFKKEKIWGRAIRFFRHSPFLTGLFVIVFLQFFAVHFLEFQFTKAVDEKVNIAQISAENSTERHAELLTHSIGEIHITIYGILLLLQLFAASRITRKLGVVRTFAIGPVASFFGFLGMFFHFGFSSAAVARGAFEIGNGIGRNAFGAAFYAMRENFRAEAKEFLEGVARPAGSLIGTIFIVGLQNLFSGETLTSILSGILVLVAAISSFLAFRLQKNYTLLSRKNLESRKNLDEKIDAIEILSQPGHQNAVDYLVRALEFRREMPEIRVKILKTLGKIQKTDAIPAILKCLDDENKKVQMAAVSALGNFQNLGESFFEQSFSKFQISKKLKKIFFQSKNKNLKIAAVKVLANFRDAEIVPILIETLKKDDPEIRAEAIAIVGLFRDPSTIEFLTPHLNDENPAVRAAAISALWPFVPLRLRLILEMTKMLESKNRDEILSGIDALGNTKWAAEKPRLSKFLKSDDEEIRHRTAAALAKMNDENAIDHLFYFLFHPKKTIGKKTRKLLKVVHDDIRRAVRKKSLREVARRISAIFQKAKTNILEHLPEKDLRELGHLFSLVDAEKEVFKIQMAIAEREK